MNQNNKRIAIGRARWVYLCGFLLDNEIGIKAMLSAVMDPSMLRAQVVLHGVRGGTPRLSVEVEYPDPARDRVVVLSLNRPVPYMEDSVRRYIEVIDMTHVLAGVANQIEVA